MPSLYHGVPRAMRGSTLFPLNRLRQHDPELYAREIAKYDDHPQRRLLPETRLETLNCLWNDVVHCSPIHPHLLYRTWRDAGVDPGPGRAFFRIPIAQVAHLPIGWMEGRAVRLVDRETYAELTTVPDATRTWYRQLAAQGRQGADFVGIPHVLVRGEIETVGLEVVRWGDPPRNEDVE